MFLKGNDPVTVHFASISPVAVSHFETFHLICHMAQPSAFVDFSTQPARSQRTSHRGRAAFKVTCWVKCSWPHDKVGIKRRPEARRPPLIAKMLLRPSALKGGTICREALRGGPSGGRNPSDGTPLRPRTLSGNPGFVPGNLRRSN